jgi:uncharacterized SAM-binding protein YcdF (DUF218 family)
MRQGTVPALVVLGHSLGGTRRRLVAEAERAARDVGAGVVVFSGWAANGGSSEAQRMRALWRGPTVEFVLEEQASTTAENATRTIPLLVARGVTDAVVVCTPMHVLRARWIFRQVYSDHGIRVRFRLARELPTPGALLWELGALTLAARQARAARTKRRRA